MEAVSAYLVSMEIKFNELYAALQELDVSDEVVREYTDSQRDARVQVLHGLEVEAVVLYKHEVLLIFYYILIVLTPLFTAAELFCDCPMKHLQRWR